MDLVTGEFQVTTLNDFSMVCGEIRNLRAREVVLGYELPEQEERVFVSQMNLLLSHVETALDDVQLLGDQLSELEKRKRLENFSSMSTRHKWNWATSKKPIIMRFAISCRWTLRPRLVLIWQRMRELGRNMVAYIGIWMKPRRPWVVVCCGPDSETLSRFETDSRAPGHHSGLYGSFLWTERFDRQP